MAPQYMNIKVKVISVINAIL